MDRDLNDLARDYVGLALRLDQHIDGFVDCYFGPGDLAVAARRDPRTPAELVEHARQLGADLADADPGPRTEYLSAQTRGLECMARRCAGAEMSLIAEIEQCYGLSVGLADPETYRRAHDALDELIPGSGPLGARLADFHVQHTVAGESLLKGLRAVAGELRPRVHELFDLPTDESVEFELVDGVPWNAYNDYRGGFHSHIRVSHGAGRNLGALPILVTHEAYGGHHLERCLKERALAQHLEHTIAIVNTPQSLVSEGIGEIAIDIVLGPGWGRWTGQILAEMGIDFDGDILEDALRHYRELFSVRQDVMLLVHDRNWSRDEAIDYVERWLLYPRERAAQMVDFVLTPLWRSYVVTYIEGRRLLSNWVSAQPSPVAAFRTLLAEPRLPHHLVHNLPSAERNV